MTRASKARLRRRIPLIGLVPTLPSFTPGGAGAGAITGTAPVLASLVNGNTLSSKVTWGSYSGTGTITTTKQMKLNAGSWVAYVGGTVVNTGEMWTVRELVSDTFNTNQVFSSGFQIVLSAALAPSQFGIGDWVVNPTMTTGSATFTIINLPADNGSAITALQYRIGAGSWVSFGGIVPGNYAVTGLTDGVQNSMTVRAVNASGDGTASAAKFVTSQTSAALVTGTSATIVAGGITWTLSSARPYGVTDTGIVTVDWTSGLTILSRSPAQTTDGGFIVNGTQKNPVRGNLGDNSPQAFHQVSSNWDASKLASFPLSVADNDIVVGAVNSTGSYVDDTTIRDGLNASYSGLFFKSGGLPVNAVAPALIGWAGRGTPVSYAINVVDVAASLPAYSLSGIPYPTVADVIGKLDRLEISLGITDADAPTGYESLLTKDLGDGNYGRDVAKWYGAAGLHLVGDVATATQKQTLLKSMVRHGVQWFDPPKGTGDPPIAQGGHAQFQMLPVYMALHYLARVTDLNTVATVYPTSQTQQTFSYTADLLTKINTPHSSTSLPMVSRRRTVSNVTFPNITISTERSGDGAWMNAIGMLLVRESDNATALITGMPDVPLGRVLTGSSTTRVTIDAQPGSPFAVSDVVYMRRPETIYEGDLDWRAEKTEWAIFPAYAQEYRALQFYSDDILALRAQGIWRDAWADAERYTALGNRSSDPSGARDYPTHHDSVNGFAFAENFWNTHAATVLGSYPVILTQCSLSGTGAVGTNLTAVDAVVAPSAGLTRTNRYYNNGVLVQTGGSTYTVVAGDVGDNLTLEQTIVNAKGTQISRSAPVIGNAGYTVNAVNFDGTDWGAADPVNGIGTSQQGALVLTFRYNTTWTNYKYVVNGTNAGGQQRFFLQVWDNNRIAIELYNSAGTQIGYFYSANAVFSVDTYYTIAISWDTTTSTWVARYRPNGGSWATLNSSIVSLTASSTLDAIGRMNVGASNGGGSGVVTNFDMADLWLDFGQKPDFTDSAVLAKFLPTVSKGATGSLPTGTAPHFFFSGATATWLTNDGTAGGLTASGTLTAASAQPT